MAQPIILSYPLLFSILPLEDIDHNKVHIIEDAWGFSGIASITLSRDFSVETLTGV